MLKARTAKAARQFFTLHASLVPDRVHVITVEDYALVNNGANGDHRSGMSPPITVRVP